MATATNTVGASMEAPASGDAPDAEIRVSLFTQDPKYALPDTPISVPGRLRRIHLSQMVNHLLRLDPSVPFDFLVNGEFLRVSLSKSMDMQGLFKEEILKIEFVEAMAPPQPPHDHPHDDWVSAVSGRVDGMCLTGCYDTVVRVWNTSGEAIASLAGHSGAVKAVQWLPSESMDEYCCLSGSQDETLRQWHVAAGSRKGECKVQYVGHTAGVTDVAVQPTGKMFASASVDRSIRLWSCTLPATGGDVSAAAGSTGKRRRTGNAETIPLQKSLGKLLGSNGTVSALAWPERGTLYSGGDDQNVRQWDVEVAKAVHSVSGGKVINDVAYSAKNQLIASADFDGAVRLYNPKSADGSVVKLVLSSHKQPCSAVAWSPGNQHQLVSASFDDEGNNLKLWDIRSRKIPIHNIAGHEGKVLAVDWPSLHGVVAGGTDGKMKMHSWQSS